MTSWSKCGIGNPRSTLWVGAPHHVVESSLWSDSPIMCMPCSMAMTNWMSLSLWNVQIVHFEKWQICAAVCPHICAMSTMKQNNIWPWCCVIMFGIERHYHICDARIWGVEDISFNTTSGTYIILFKGAHMWGQTVQYITPASVPVKPKTVLIFEDK
jgi:hypothetical protein